jgi:hypothetical protein
LPECCLMMPLRFCANEGIGIPQKEQKEMDARTAITALIAL